MQPLQVLLRSSAAAGLMLSSRSLEEIGSSETSAGGENNRLSGTGTAPRDTHMNTEMAKGIGVAVKNTP